MPLHPESHPELVEGWLVISGRCCMNGPSPAAAGFPNRNTALRLIGALCMEQAEEWLTGRQYLDISLPERGNHKQEADLKLDPAPWRGEAAESFLQHF